MAQFLGAYRTGKYSDERRSQFRGDARGSYLPALRRALGTCLCRRPPTHRPALLHKLGLATVQEIRLTACARPGNFWPLVAKQRRLASDAKPNAVLIEPGVREPASPRKWLSVLDSFFLEDSGHHRGISIECYRDFLVGNLIGGWSGCFDRLQALALVGKRAVEFGV